MITNFLFLGRILNRFSQDTGLVDDNLPDVIFEINTVRIIKLLNEMKSYLIRNLFDFRL